MPARSPQASDLGVVVLSYQADPRLTESVASIVASDPSPGRVLVVDNGSPAASLDPLLAGFPDVETHRLAENLGYGGAMNVGADQLARAGCTRLLFLTHEVVLAPGALGTLLDHLDRHPEAGLVGPTLGVLSKPGTVWSAGGELTRIRHAPFHLEVGLDVERTKALGNKPVTWLDGACLLARTDAFVDAGGFRADLFLYCEDVDLALKMHRRGWTVECVRGAVAWQESSTSPPYLDARNRALVLGGWGTVGVVIDLLIRTVSDPFHGRGLRRVKLMVLGLVDAVRGQLDRSIALDRRS